MFRKIALACLISTVALAQEGRLAFTAYDEAAGRHLPYTYDLATSDLREIPLPIEADCGDLALIYDGSRVAVELNAGGEAMLYVCPTRTGEVAAHREPFPGAEPSWIEYTVLAYTIDGDLWHWDGVTDPLKWQPNVGRSPVHRDWLNIYYVRDYPDGGQAVVHVNVNEGAEEAVLSTERVTERLDDLDLSPDGRYLALSWLESSGAILLLDLEEGGPPVRAAISAGELRWPSFSPDGGWLAYYDAEAGAVMAVPVEGGEPVKLCDVSDCRGLDWGPTPEDW
jgi:hypothetical protein